METTALLPVLSPGVTHTDGYIYTKKEVEALCNSFNVQVLKFNPFNEASPFSILQSFIHPVAYTTADGETHPAGTWYQKIHTNNPEIIDALQSGEFSRVQITAD